MKQIAIIGGGLGGLVTAIALKQRGFLVRVYEKCKRFENVGADIGLWPNALQILDQIGVYEKICQKSGHYDTIKIGTEQGDVAAEISVNTLSKVYPPINICRYELQQILVNALGAENLEFNKQSIQIIEAKEKVHVTFQDGSSIFADLLIGADGANSFVREYVEPGARINFSGYISFGGLNTEPFDIRLNYIYGDFYSGSFPVDSRRQIFFFVTPHKDCDLLEKYPTLAAQFALFRNTSPLMDSMLDSLETTFSKSDGRNSFFTKNFYLDPLKKWHKSRVVLMGEAAHLVGPLLGSASTIVFEGAYQLALSLFKTNNHKEAFADFQARHQPRANEFLALERELFAMFEDKTSLQRMEKYLAFNRRLFAFLSTNMLKDAPIFSSSQQYSIR